MTASDQVEAGIRISAHGTVLDATIDGLLHRRETIEAQLISRLKQEMGSDD